MFDDIKSKKLTFDGWYFSDGSSLNIDIDTYDIRENSYDANIITNNSNYLAVVYSESTLHVKFHTFFETIVEIPGPVTVLKLITAFQDFYKKPPTERDIAMAKQEITWFDGLEHEYKTNFEILASHCHFEGFYKCDNNYITLGFGS